MVLQYRAVWNVPGGGLGYSTFHVSEGDPAAIAGIPAPIRTFFDAVKGVVPNEATITFESEVIRLDNVTGELEDTTAVSPPTPVVGTVSTGWAGGTGFRVDWLTGVVQGGTRIKGRTFVVPGSGFDTNGLPTSTSRTTVGNAATALIGGLAANGTPLVVWSRRYGLEASVTTATVAQKSALLRSRRD